MSNYLEIYKNVGFNQVEGWCSNMLFTTVRILSDCDINKHGGALEIGVHHGKFYILLNSVISSDHTSYAVDVFDNQLLNIDNSGAGSLSIFQSNLVNFDLHKGVNTKIISGDSTDSSLMLPNVIGLGKLRFISVDGGHTVEHTVSDLILANQLISNEGVVILDDILNSGWLGVIEGVGRFLDKKPTLVPFAIGHNKLYMSKLSFRNYYYQLFKSNGLFDKDVLFYGWNIINIKNQ